MVQHRAIRKCHIVRELWRLGCGVICETGARDDNRQRQGPKQMPEAGYSRHVHDAKLLTRRCWFNCNWTWQRVDLSVPRSPRIEHRKDRERTSEKYRCILWATCVWNPRSLCRWRLFFPAAPDELPFPAGPETDSALPGESVVSRTTVLHVLNG